jgi:O-antigen ligase
LIAVFFMGEQHRETFVTRFSSIFAEKEERDVSAKSRVSFTEKGLEMIFDYPMGSGGEAAFRSNRGMTYIASVGETRFRSCHNGYIDIAASWGAQGLFLYLGTLLVIMWKVARASRRVYESNEEASFVGACFCAMISLQLVTCYFGSFLDGEWYYWWMALGVAYLRLTDPDVNLMPAEHPHEHEFNGTQTKTSFVS